MKFYSSLLYHKERKQKNLPLYWLVVTGLLKQEIFSIIFLTNFDKPLYLVQACEVILINPRAKSDFQV